MMLDLNSVQEKEKKKKLKVCDEWKHLALQCVTCLLELISKYIKF